MMTREEMIQILIDCDCVANFSAYSDEEVLDLYEEMIEGRSVEFLEMTLDQEN